jgi:hypothetical protein
MDLRLAQEGRSSENSRANPNRGSFLRHHHRREHSIRSCSNGDDSVILENDYPRKDSVSFVVG